VLLSALKHFVKTYLATNDVHVVAAAFDSEVRKNVIAGYFKAVAALQAAGEKSIPRGPAPKLFDLAKNGETEIYALFGGQGTNEVYFDELQGLFDLYAPFVGPLIQKITAEILVPLAEKEESTTYYTYGMDVYGWLTGTVARPPVAYLASIPLSLPLIGLTQLVQYLVSVHAANLTPGEFRSRISGATGHSQGVVAAVAISASSTFEEFEVNALKALKWLFYCGMRGQQSFPVLALEPEIVKDAIEGGEGTPTPMLSVTGLALADLEKQIKATNKHLPPNSQLEVSLLNGPKAFVVTGPARALHGLVTVLRKVKAPSGTDQSKVPYSQRKPVFSVRYLVIGVPYHSRYLEGAAEKLSGEDLGGVELWEGKELGIPVYNTMDGAHFFRLDFLASIADGHFTRIEFEGDEGDHPVVVRPDLHAAHPLGQGDRFPAHRYPRDRFRSRWTQWDRASYR
jgi:fatty acid synthase subunit beta